MKDTKRRAKPSHGGTEYVWERNWVKSQQYAEWSMLPMHKMKPTSWRILNEQKHRHWHLAFFFQFCSMLIVGTEMCLTSIPVWLDQHMPFNSPSHCLCYFIYVDFIYVDVVASFTHFSVIFFFENCARFYHNSSICEHTENPFRCKRFTGWPKKLKDYSLSFGHPVLKNSWETLKWWSVFINFSDGHS